MEGHQTQGPPSTEPKIETTAGAAQAVKTSTTKMENEKHEEESPEDRDYYAKMYNQLLLSLWNRIAETSERYQTNKIEADINVDDRLRHVINEYLKQNPKKLTADVNEAFISLFHKYRPRSSEQSVPVPWTKDYIDGMLPLALLVVIVLFGLVVFCYLPSRWMRLVWPIFYISWIWTWIFLYKKEIAQRHANLLKTQHDACAGPTNLPWWLVLGRYMHSYFSVADDECLVIQEQISVDPWLEVHPFMALSQMIIMTLVNPASTVAEAIAKFVRVIVKDLPVFLSAGVLIVIVFLFIIFCLCLFNYRFRIPFLFAIEPSPRSESSVDDSTIREVQTSLLMIERRTSTMSEQLSSFKTPALTNGRRPSEEKMKSSIGRRIRRRLVDAAGDQRADTEVESETDVGEEDGRREVLSRRHSVGCLNNISRRF